jgi:predicted RNA binding protein YcfA (HicA-like mRNA interferase family)
VACIQGTPRPGRAAAKGLELKRQSGGSHRILERVGWADFVFAFHDDVEIGPRMLARIAKHTGLQPGDL